MSWWDGLILGIVQGLTEFLPVSSSGHLVVTEAVLGVRVPGVFVEVALHVATLVAVLIVYRRRVLELVSGALTGKGTAWRSVGLLLLASVPAGVVGVLFNDFFERTFHALGVVGVDFLVTGVILWSAGRARTGGRSEPDAKGALAIGLAQACAILPGISRSGSTVTAGIWTGVDPVRAAEFSFLMAVPAIAGAAVLHLPALSRESLVVGAGPLVLSFVAALVSGVLAMRLLVRLLARRAFHRFAPYCWAIGAVTLVWALLR